MEIKYAQKQLVLTNQDKAVLMQFYEIMDNDDDLILSDVWELLYEICNTQKFNSTPYGYDIIITN